MPIRPATADAISDAAEILRIGGLVAFPTETVYGLGADATNARAVAGIFAAKGRPLFNPLIAHVADVGDASRYAILDHRAEALAAAFWPGALTLVLRKTPHCPIARWPFACRRTRSLRHSSALRVFHWRRHPRTARGTSARQPPRTSRRISPTRSQ